MIPSLAPAQVMGVILEETRVMGAGSNKENAVSKVQAPSSLRVRV
jgi:hypothetical protein